MKPWFFHAVVSLVLMGTQRFFYKVSAERQCNTAWTTFSFMATVSVLSLVLFFALGSRIRDLSFLFLIALVNSGTFLTSAIGHMEALKEIPAGIAYPFIRLNAILVVLFSLLYFHDPLSVYQGIGIVLALVVMATFARDLHGEQGHAGNVKRGFLLVSLSMLAGSMSSISSKFAAIHTDKMAFIALSYILSTLVSFGLRHRLQTRKASKNHRQAVIIGIGMGVLNLGGYYAFLQALSEGPLSVIASIAGMHFVIAVMLATLIYKERLTPFRGIGIVLTIVSIILLRL